MLINDNGNIKDRGNIKWTSLMLVEHKRKLKELKEREQEREKPELDPQQLEEMNYVFQKALAQNRSVKIEYYQEQRISQLVGMISKVLLEERELIVEREKGQGRKNLHLDDILNIIMVE